MGWYIKKSFRYEEVSGRIVFYASGGVQVDGEVVNKKTRFVTEKYQDDRFLRLWWCTG